MSKRIVFPALVAACVLVAGPVSSQNPNPQVAPNAGVQMTQSTEAALKQDLAAAKKKVADLTQALADCQKARDAALAKANVKMFCADNVTSKNSAGAAEHCSPYVCSQVSGQCVKRCGTTADCAGGFACDTNGSGNCVSTR